MGNQSSGLSGLTSQSCRHGLILLHNAFEHGEDGLVIQLDAQFSENWWYANKENSPERDMEFPNARMHFAASHI